MTAWSIEVGSGPRYSPAQDKLKAHSDLGLSNYEVDVTAHEIRSTLYSVGVPRQEVNEFTDIIASCREEVA